MTRPRLLDELSADEWLELAAEAQDRVQVDSRNAAFHAESARMFERAAAEAAA